VTVFSNFIDISALNASILWAEIYPKWEVNKLQKRRLFLQKLGEGFATPHIQRRSRLYRAEVSTLMVKRFRGEDSVPPSASQKYKCISQRRR